MKKFGEFVFQDVSDANETKKVALIIRIKSLIMGVYFLMQTILFAADGLYPMAFLVSCF